MRRGGLLSFAAVAIMAWGGPGAHAQAPAGPSNALPNPFRTVSGWARLPQGRTWGSTSAVDIARDGTGIWVAERCGANSCAGADLDPVLLFDASGRLVRSFGAGLLLSPHGIAVDPEGNVWVTDCACTGSQEQRNTPGKGHQVFKFSPEGQVLMVLGKAGGGRGPEHFWQPNDVLVAPNGDIFVAEGHSSAEGANARILKFDRSGGFVKEWGGKGTGLGEFDQPHALAMDSQGLLYVGDRSNNRIQVFDQSGTYIREMSQFSRPSGLFIDRDDVLYVADSESGSVAPAHRDWKRGIRIGSARDGIVRFLIPDPVDSTRGTSAAEGVAVDANGVIYGAEVGRRALRRYVKP